MRIGIGLLNGVGVLNGFTGTAGLVLERLAQRAHRAFGFGRLAAAQFTRPVRGFDHGPGDRFRMERARWIDMRREHDAQGALAGPGIVGSTKPDALAQVLEVSAFGLDQLAHSLGIDFAQRLAPRLGSAAREIARDIGADMGAAGQHDSERRGERGERKVTVHGRYPWGWEGARKARSAAASR